MGADKHRRDCDHPGAGRGGHDPMGLAEREKGTEMIKNWYITSMAAENEVVNFLRIS